jgi:hypothetical protein
MIEKEQYSKSFNIIRWLAPSLVFIAIWFHAFDVYPIGPIFHLSGAILWVYVGIKTKEGPILLNFVPQIPVWTLGLVYYFLGR